MSLRDWFAGQALVSFGPPVVEPGWQKDRAWMAYSIARAMLAARMQDDD
jgi:hypothetical protein